MSLLDLLLAAELGDPEDIDSPCCVLCSDPLTAPECEDSQTYCDFCLSISDAVEDDAC